MKDDRGNLDLTKEIENLKGQVDGFKALLQLYKKQLWDLKLIQSENEKNKHLQEYLDKFTEGPNGMRGNAVSNARIYIMTSKGYLEEIKRIEVHESNNPKDTSIRVVLKPNKEEKLILPPGYIKDY